MRVAEAAVAAFKQHVPLAGLLQVEQHLLVGFVENLGAGGNPQHHRFSGGAGAVGPHAVMADLRLEMLLIAVVDQRVEVGHGFDDHVAAAAAVAAVRPAILDEFLAPEADRAGAAVAALEEDLGLIEKFHDCLAGNEKGGMRPFPLLRSELGARDPGRA